jgi:hypothetical protein
MKAMKNKRIKKWWRYLTQKYNIFIEKESTLEDIARLRIHRMHLILFLVLSIGSSLVLSSLLILNTPLRNYLPGYLNRNLRDEMIHNLVRLDSMQQVMKRQELYMLNVQDIMRGKVKVDSVYSIDSLTVMRADSLITRTHEEEDFRRRYEEREKLNLTTIVDERASEQFAFYRPVEGVLSTRFDLENKHFGIDIITHRNENVMAVFDGIIVMSDFTATDGYVIQVLHSQGFIAVYKHCTALLKKVGQKVTAGEVLALTGQVLQQKKPKALHFELWRNGRALDPEKYIVF